jgi:hypothetical protein
MSGEPHLRLGDHSPWVQYAQVAMEEKGVPAGKNPDEAFDDHTHHQVLTFQHEHHVHPSGELDEQTWAALGGVAAIHEQAEDDGGGRRGEDMAHLRTEVIQIAKDFLKGYFDEVSRATSDFHQHASDQAQLVGEVEGPDVGALFEIVTAGIGALFPEAELAHLVAELVVIDYKAAVEAGKAAAVSADKKAREDIIGLAQHLHDTTTYSAHLAYAKAERELTGDGNPAVQALQKLERLPMAHEREWLEYCVIRYLGIPNPAQQSPYLYIREPLEEQLARIVAKQKFHGEYGDRDTPFWNGQERDREEGAVIDVQMEYEHRGWREHPGQQRPPSAPAG